MKKRIIITLFFVVGISSILLALAIFKLYTEAEKVQRSIFVNEVLTAGDDIIDRLDIALKKDTLDLSMADSVGSNKVDTTGMRYLQRSRRFVIDSVSGQPTGVISTTIYLKDNDTRILSNDTILFSESFRKMFPTSTDPWSPKNNKNSSSPEIKDRDANLAKLDSSTLKMLSRDNLKLIIKDALQAENIDNRFDFALYNAFSSEFLVEPTSVSKEQMLQSEYVFRLKYNEKISSPIYVILHFPVERGIYLQRMSTLVILIITLLFVSFTISFVALYSLYRQKKLSEVTNEFVNNMTHEFKTPISTISLACEALADPTMLKDKSMRETYVSIIVDENDRLKNMVSNILQIAQLKKGQVKMNVELLDMHDVIHKVTDSIALQIKSSQGTLNLALNADDHKIFGDKSHLENVLVNLIENAIKYSQNAPEILINTQSNQKYFLISVTDKGIGIPKKAIANIFENFYRVPKGNVHNVKGYGLGLGYVNKIIHLHKGKIEVQSEEGKGSTFMIYLPIKKQ